MNTSPANSPILFKIIGSSIVKITINRPKVLNALNWAAMDDFKRAIDRAVQTSGARVLLLTATGQRAFCAGGDLGELATYPTEADGQRMSAIMTSALKQLENLPYPTIAAMNGLARGGGAEIALACDIRLLAEDATIGFTQINLALTTGWGGGQRLLRLVGYARAIELLTTGRILSARQARGYGIVNHIYPTEQIQTMGMALAKEIAAQPAPVVASYKLLLKEALSNPAEAATLEQSIFPPLWGADDHNQRVQNFLNRKR